MTFRMFSSGEECYGHTNSAVVLLQLIHCPKVTLRYGHRLDKAICVSLMYELISAKLGLGIPKQADWSPAVGCCAT